MNIIYRKADIADIPALIQLRLDYLRSDKGELSEPIRNEILSQLRVYFPTHLNRDLIVFLAEADGIIVSTAFLTIADKPANPSFITGRTGTALNVYTCPEYRRRGIATEVLKHMIDAAKDEKLSYIELSATESGKPLYEKLGFKIRESHYTGMKLQLINEAHGKI